MNHRYILGISAFYHDSAAVIIHNGHISGAVQEERFTRLKQDASFPSNSVKYCLYESGIKLSEIDAVVFYDKPFLKFERILENYYLNTPRGLRSFVNFAPVWLKEKLFLRSVLEKELREIDNSFSSDKTEILFPEHHLSHAASAFFPSPFSEAAILTIDGVGEWATSTIMCGKGNSITGLRELHFPDSVGLLYSAFTYFLGFRVNSGEYKLMGLAPYGNPDSEQTAQFRDIIRKKLVDIKKDGSIKLNSSFFTYATGMKMINSKKWEQIFGINARKPSDPIEQSHSNLAMAIQDITEEIVFSMAETAKKITGSKNLCMAGGVALNCVANGRLLKSDMFEKIWIQPAAGDAGGALGAALAAHHMFFNDERTPETPDGMQGSYLGPSFKNKHLDALEKKFDAKACEYSDFSELCKKTAELLDSGNVVGWFQGRMEWGPRALGNRSILADARNRDMQKKLNLKIKYREGFRPFAPSVLDTDKKKFFDIKKSSPYMLFVADVLENRQEKLVDNYHELPWKEKLYFMRSDIPAVTHLDFSARIQTVHRETNPRYWELINAFKKRTNYGIVINTSFNVRGEPIVRTPEDAYRCFMRTEMDYLVINNRLYSKKEQPGLKNLERFEEKFRPD